MTMTFAKQTASCATMGDAAWAARAFVAILLITGTVLTVSLFVFPHPAAVVRLIPGILLPILLIARRCPRFRSGKL